MESGPPIGNARDSQREGGRLRNAGAVQPVKFIV